MKQVTIQDIARVAGVSKSTVSRVLNGTVAVHPDKRDAVLDATKRLGFKPNVFARSLARGNSMTIGVLTQLIGSPFYDTIAQGVIAGLGDSGYSPLFADGQLQKSKEIEAVRALIGRQVDGLVLIGGGVPGDEIVDLRGELPTVIVARQLASDRHHCISMDNIDAASQATQYLIERGHRKIAVICGLKHHTDTRDRLSGFQQAMRENDLPIEPHLILDGDFSAESGQRCIEQLLARSESFTAVFAFNDMMAFGARLALYRREIRVPHDVSLIGFDDQMEAAFTTPPLTTVRQPARKMGEQAARSVLAMIQGQTTDSEPIRGTLIERESVAQANENVLGQ